MLHTALSVYIKSHLAYELVQCCHQLSTHSTPFPSLLLTHTYTESGKGEHIRSHTHATPSAYRHKHCYSSSRSTCPLHWQDNCLAPHIWLNIHNLLLGEADKAVVYSSSTHMAKHSKCCNDCNRRRIVCCSRLIPLTHTTGHSQAHVVVHAAVLCRTHRTWFYGGHIEHGLVQDKSNMVLWRTHRI